MEMQAGFLKRQRKGGGGAGRGTLPHRGILCFQPGPVQLLRQLSCGPWALWGRECLLPALTWSLLAPLRVPTVPVKNLTGSSPVNPALAGEDGAAAGAGSPGTGGQTAPVGRDLGSSWGPGCCWFSSLPFVTSLRRDHGDPHERGRAARVPDPAPQAGAAPPARQQERDPVHPRHLPLLPQDHQETGQEG